MVGATEKPDLWMKERILHQCDFDFDALYAD